MKKLIVLILALTVITASAHASINLSCRATSVGKIKFKPKEARESLIPAPEFIDDTLELTAIDPLTGKVTASDYFNNTHSAELFGGSTFAVCKDKQNNIYGVQYSGGGASMYISNTAFRVICPLVSKKRITPEDLDDSAWVFGNFNSRYSAFNTDAKPSANGREFIETPRPITDRANFWGVEVRAIAGLGVGVGVFANLALGVCFVPSIEFGIGGGVSTGVLSIVQYKDQNKARELAKPYFKKLR